jgi:6-phosphogluconate dehydrogenase
MVHNGIEYGDMQLIAEAYDLLRNVTHLSAEQMAEIFDEWNKGELESYLIEITAKILSLKDKETGKPLVDLVADTAGQKGTGKWTSQVAQDLGIAIPTIEAALTSRNISARKRERVAASRLIGGRKLSTDIPPGGQFIEGVREALYVSKICSYAQGMSLIRAGSDEWKWNINLSEMARIWQGGCIIRARFLRRIKEAFARNPDLPNLMVDDEFRDRLERAQEYWRLVISSAVQQGVPVLAMTSSLGYFDLYRSANLPLNLTQAQRDFFGSHTYERIDKPELGFIHTEWEQLLGQQQEEH